MSRTAVAASTSLAALMLIGCAGRPELISADGMLGGCEQPRCVSSQSKDPDHYIEPIRYEGSREAARAALQRRDARSDPASGSENPWHHTSLPSSIRGR